MADAPLVYRDVVERMIATLREIGASPEVLEIAERVRHEAVERPATPKRLTGEAEALAIRALAREAQEIIRSRGDSPVEWECTQDQLCRLLASWLERHDAALREREGLACTDCKEYRAKVAGRIALAQQMVEAIEATLDGAGAQYNVTFSDKPETFLGVLDGKLERLRAALAAWRSGEGKP